MFSQLKFGCVYVICSGHIISWINGLSDSMSLEPKYSQQGGYCIFSFLSSFSFRRNFTLTNCSGELLSNKNTPYFFHNYFTCKLLTVFLDFIRARA